MQSYSVLQSIGLKLTRGSGPLEAIVIDRLEQTPAGN